MQVETTLVGYAALFGTLDTLVQATVFDEREQPPGTAQPGDAYLVAADAGGDWQGQDRAIAVWLGSNWLFAPPVEGASVRRLDTGQMLIYSDGWSAALEPAEPTGGTTVDAEARAAIAALISALRHSGIFPAG